LLNAFLGELPQHPAQPLTVFAFEIKLLRELGQSPDLQATPLSPGARQILQKTGELDWSSVSHLKPSVAQAGELQQFLHGFLIFHLGKLPRGRSAALGLH
jgi:recombinational DNA repair protein (RecF pathway)